MIQDLLQLLSVLLSNEWLVLLVVALFLVLASAGFARSPTRDA